ncbi:putative ABC transport system permease protein [Hydrogenispora ethanolica]|uniref:Putative ABC transport system permease protein n=1 Tax=Hydrogenispora ethanolica TaxID=1082276 RepID=A0A4R1QM07_HYDET|nr:FtsX-like permease family protein [Hydrogenispora ethanolica]TCL54748.1 putative ABC transport system permease protein [Hydrogenispora ethanolica]
MVLVGANLKQLTNEFENRCVQEDASFTTEKSIDNLPELESAADAVIEEGKTFDYTLSEGKTLRIFSKNDRVNIPAIIEGKELSGSGDILLNPAFAAAHDYKIGDVLTILDKQFTVAGFMALPNYIYPLKSETDIMYSPQNFGIAVISREDFTALGKGSNFYAVKFNHPEERPRAQSAKFIALLKSRGIGITQWTDIGGNSRVRSVTMKNDSINLNSKVVPTVTLLLATILLSNVIGRLIKRESVIAGALYALGYKRKEIYRHYLKFPLMIAVIGGVLGTILGLFIVRPGLLFLLGYFYIPLTGIDYSPTVMIISLLLPALFLGLSGWFVIRRELKHSPVELMKGDQEKSKVNFLERMFKLEKLKFAAKFKIRKQLRSLSRLALLLTGCAAATVLLLYGFFLKSSMDYLLTSSLKGAYNFQYEYWFKSPRTEPAPPGSEPFSGSKFLPVGEDNRDFYVVGVLPDSKLYTLVDESGARLSMNQVILTKPIAEQLKVKQGDTVNIVRKADYQEFSLKVDSIANAYNRFIFMPLAEYNEKFGMPEGSYTGLGSNKLLDIPENQPYGVVSIEDKAAAVRGSMAPVAALIVFVSVVAFIIGMMIIYVVTSMIIEENKSTISLMKIFGYRKKEVNFLILNSSTMVVVIGYVIGIPLSFAAMGGLMKALENSVTFSMPVMIDPLYMGVGFAVVMLSYELSKLLCRKKINAVSMSEALKAGTE